MLTQREKWFSISSLNLLPTIWIHVPKGLLVLPCPPSLDYKGQEGRESVSMSALTSWCPFAPKYIHLTLKQHWFEQHGCIYMPFFFPSINTVSSSPLWVSNLWIPNQYFLPAVVNLQLGMWKYHFSSAFGWIGRSKGPTVESEVICRFWAGPGSVPLMPKLFKIQLC